MSLDTLSTRIQYLGGDNLGRIKKEKLESLRWALRNDYNSRKIITPTGERHQCLINLNNLKPDYDKKYISIEFNADLEPGDVFKVIDDDTHWMVYLPDLAEIAYLRSEIIRCRYNLWLNGHKYWFYFQGPTETAIEWGQKKTYAYSSLNYSGTIYIKNTPDTKEHFKRFTKIKIDGHMWRVTVADPISVPGILELEVEEYFDNTPKEMPEVYQEEETEMIIGKKTCKPGEIVGYIASDSVHNENIHWHISDKHKAKIIDVFENGKICKIKVFENTTGTFELHYGEDSIEIEIDSAEPVIEGPQIVYPYDVVKYKCNINKNSECSFSVDNELAVIIEEDGNECLVEIVSSKKGNFTLTAWINEEAHLLPIEIKSL